MQGAGARTAAGGALGTREAVPWSSLVSCPWQGLERDELEGPSNPKDSVILTALRLPRPGEMWLLDPVPAEGQLLPPLLDIGNVSRGQLSTWHWEKLILAGEKEVGVCRGS